MKHLSLKLVVSSISVLILYLVGILGECLINIMHTVISDGADLPSISEFVYQNYLLNRNHFILSLTPLMILHFVIVSVFHKNTQQKIYWLFFGGLWALSIVYILVFLISLILPVYILGVTPGNSLIPSLIMYTNLLIVAIALAIIIRSHLKGRRYNAS